MGNSVMYECAVCHKLFKNNGLARACESRHKIAEEQEQRKREEEEYFKERERQEKMGQPDPLEEKMAEYAHSYWSKLVEYILKYVDNKDMVERWKDQMEKKYEELNDVEKTSNRKEAREIIEAFEDCQKSDMTIPKEQCPEELKFLAKGTTVGLRTFGTLNDKGVKIQFVELMRG